VPWQGWISRALPTGVWKANFVVVGDGSGGERLVDVVFKPANVVASNQLYSLEHITVSDGDNNDKIMEVATAGFAATFGSDWGASFRILATSSTARLAVEDAVAIRGSFLGELTRTLPAIVFIRARVTNVTGAAFAGVMAGWVWGPEAKSAPGGPQRPGGGAFPA